MNKLMLCVLIAGLTNSSVAGFQPASQSPPIASYYWLNEFKERAFDELMPMALSRGVVVAYRSHRSPDIEALERHFSVRLGQDGAFNPQNFLATVVVPVGQSIQKQLLDLHTADPAASFETVLARVKIRRVTVDAKTCGAVRERVKGLETVRIGIPEFDLLFSHPFTHRVAMDLLKIKIEATLYDEDDPLVRWAVGTNAAFVACADARK